MTAVENKNLNALPHVLIVDDDERIRMLVSRYLHESGFVVLTALDARQACEIMKNFAFDALIVDIMMPGESGLDFTRRFREEENDTPILLLTALGEAGDRINGLEAGADDYLPKPFEPRELLLRLQAILRRRPQPAETPQSFRIGRWTYDSAQNELVCAETRQRLTTVEGNLLRALASRSGQAVNRDDLARLCGMDPETGERTIDVQVTRLRRKIEEDSKLPRFLHTVRGKGYMLRIGEL